jgi:hypothetical protein
MVNAVTRHDDHDLPGTPGSSPDHGEPPADPRAPADPWLTEAHTSAFEPQPGHHQPPYSGGRPVSDTIPDGFAAGPPVVEPRRRERRPGRWIVVGLAALAVGMIGLLIMDQFHGDPDGDDPAASPTHSTPAVAVAPGTAVTAASRRPSAQVQPAGTGTDAASAAASGTPSSAPSEAAGPRVVYEVTASGGGNIGSVEYTDENGDIIRRGGIPLPWRTSFTPVGRTPPLVVHAQRKGGGDSGPVTCTITVDGKLITSVTQRGKYAAPLC